MTIDDTLLNNKQDIADGLNKYFTSISKLVDKTSFMENNFEILRRKCNDLIGDNFFKLNFITPLEVKQIIDKLDSNKSTGTDGIGPKIIKACGDSITPLITSIINNSIATGVFPDVLKEARVLPIFKSGDKERAENYRPISILPTISKIIERHIALQIQEFLNLTKKLHKT